MVECKAFVESLNANEVEFFAGVPDSLLKDVCAYITDNVPNDRHLITANEGNALAVASGYHLATRKIPLVYLQNSGLGNLVNPLTSLTSADVYGIPALLMIGWRGEPGVKDEPQHVQQGRITTDLLKVLEVPYFEFSPADAQSFASKIKDAVDLAREKSIPVALVIRKDTFAPYKLSKKCAELSAFRREEAIQNIAEKLSEEDLVLATTGHIARELYEFRTHIQKVKCKDFLSVGSMGHVSQVALGVSLATPTRRVFCFDGDGSVLMHMGGLSIVGAMKPENYYHICFNNGAHGSVGGQPTVAQTLNLAEVARTNGYKSIYRASSPEELDKVWAQFIANKGPVFLEILCGTVARKDLGRPSSTPRENKLAFMESF